MYWMSSFATLCDNPLKDLKNLNVATVLVKLMDVYPNLKSFPNTMISCSHVHADVLL